MFKTTVISLLYFIIYFFTHYVVKKKLKIFDLRNKHIPLIGGCYLILCISLFIIFYDIPNYLFNSFTVIILIIMLGIIDDKYVLNRRVRLLTQIFISIYLIYYGYEIQSLSFVNSNEIYLGTFSIILSIFYFVAAMNAYNFYDGYDGQLAINSIITIISIIFLNLSNGETIIQNEFTTHFIIFTFIFLIFNVSNTRFKSFLGDSGSITIGLFLSILVLEISIIKNYVNIILCLWLSLPLSDFFRVVISRVLKSRNPTLSYQDHIHSILSKKFNKKLWVNLITLSIQVFMIIMFIIFYYYDLILYSLISYMLFFSVYYKIMEKLERSNSQL